MADDAPSALDLIYDPLSVRSWIARELPTHPPTADCPDLECLVCGVRDCPHGEPLHYHHDGCPAGWTCPRKAPGAEHCACRPADEPQP